MRYHVRIEYREPEFELRIGRKKRPYLTGYDFEARDQGEAARLAVAAFQGDARESGVGWRRVIHRLIVDNATEVPDGRPTGSGLGSKRKGNRAPKVPR